MKKKNSSPSRPKTKEPSEASQSVALKTLRDDKGKIWSHVRQKWLIETPEERVRQEFLCILVNEYGFAVDQIGEEEELTGRGTGQARADFVIWRTIEEKQGNKSPLIIVECKSDNVTIKREDYYQGDNYARIVMAPFVVTHNTRETRFWRVLKDRMPGYLEEIENIPHATDSDEDINKLLERLKTFKEDEFADLLHQCHNVIRNREKKDPVAAFDEIAKILFVKVYVERQLKQKRQRKNLFTVDFLKEQIGDSPLEDLFQKTRKHYAGDQIFEKDETLNLKPATGLEIVKLLERYNLSDTSEDIKGIAFERFLGRTFRGEIGQFFTPRCIVEFMVRMVNPKEGDVICDPASGSGGFLIRFFEIVREQILADADRQYQEYKAEVESKRSWSELKRAEALREKYEQLQTDLDKNLKGSRLWKLANRCIYGTDANDRMARTSKMNMIMHGDGHGGVHHHDGFLNVNGIFEGRFNIILTNPPFGANVEPSDVITEEQVAPPDNEDDYIREFKDLYRNAQNRIRASKGKPIASLFELPKRGNGERKGTLGKIKTEVLFLERCLDLLTPGGQLGIVLPEGIFNNPSLAYVREFCEDRAHIRAVVSLPQETFYSSGATVKASLLFMQKFTGKHKAEFDEKKATAEAEVRAKYKPEIEKETARLSAELEGAKKKRDAQRIKKAQGELRKFLQAMEETLQTETRALLKDLFPYPIFLYEAERVGISSTGEAVQNELYPNPSQPQGTEGRTCLELYRAFQLNPKAFLDKQA